MNINSKENNISQIQENPKFIFQTPEAQRWDPNTLRFLRTAITNNLNIDTARIYQDDKFRAQFRRLCVTGVHEGGHMFGGYQVASNVNGKVNQDGSGVTTFILNARSLRQYVHNINYLGHLGKEAEKTIGETPHGHGFDMAQNDAYAALYTQISGESSSAIQSSAESEASQTTSSNIDQIIDIGVRLALAA